MAEDSELDILSVTTTVDTPAAAQALAEVLLASRLVACVQVEAGLQSHYRWEGRLQAEPEVRLTLKTLPGALPALQALLAQHHPYDLPQVLACTMRATAAYAHWVRTEVTVPATPAG